MSGFKPYPAYKDSGVKWLSDVPQHWNVRRNKQVFRLVSVRVGNKSADFQLLSLTLRGIIPRDMESGKGKFPAEFDTYQVVEPSDIVFCLFDIDETPRTVGISCDFGMITGAYTVAKTLPVADPRFIYYYYFSIDLRKGLRPFYTGLRKVVRPETFMNIELPLPPRSEQAKICNLLDHETARIDALIEEQQRLIELLKEKRQAVISHAVTKGLDPTVPMKDSGVEWLGEVPAHWDVCSVRRVIRVIEQGWSPECEANPSDEDNWGVLKAGCVNRGVFDPSENKTLPAWLEPIAEYEVRAGDILMSRASGSPELVGSTALLGEVRERLMLSDKIFRIHLEEKVSSPFFVWVMNARFMRIQIEQALSGGNGMANNLPQSSLLAFWLAVPPSHEQDAIAEYIIKLTENIDALISEGGSAVELLQERRSALISAAVTGKIDVRGWQPPASTQAPESAVAEVV